MLPMRAQTSWLFSLAMKQIRIVRKEDLDTAGRRYACEWMEASLMNRWFLRTRLAEALEQYGPDSHWIETREKPATQAVPA